MPQGTPRITAWPGILAAAAARLLNRWRRSAEVPPVDLIVVRAGEGTLRVTRITRRRGAAPLVRSASRSLPPEVDPAARAARERAALVALVAELGAKGRPAVAALDGADVTVRRLTLPRMDAADLESALELECRKQANVPLGDAVIRYELVEDPRVAATEQPLVVAIAPRLRVEEWRARFAAAGLKPWSLTVAAAGLRAGLVRRGALVPDAVVAYLDVGEDASQLVVLKGTELRFSRDLAFGVATMAAALRQIVVPGVGTLERGAQEAESLLREHGIPAGIEEARFADGVPLAAVGIMLRPSLERLARELWNSFDYCNEQFLGESVSRVVLLGPGRRIRNLDGHLAGVLKMPVVPADAEEGDERRSGAPRDAFAADGMGVGLASVPRGTLNFLEGGRARRGAAWLAEAIPAPAVAAAAALLLVSIAAPAQVSVTRARGEVAALRAELARFAAQSEAVARFRAAREEDERTKALLVRLTGSQVIWSSALRDLSHRVGPDVKLTALEIVPQGGVATGGTATPPGTPGVAASNGARSVRLSGLLRSPESSPEGVLAELLRSLSSSPVFDRVRLESCERVSAGLSSFTITARVAEGPGS